MLGQLVQRGHRFVHRLGFDVRRDQFRYRFVPALAQRDISVVVDIGANTGQFANELRRAGFAGQIISLEPLSAAFEELMDAASADPSWSAEQVAVGDRPGTATINVSANSVSSSILPILDRHTSAAPASRYVASEEVPVTTVDELFRRHGLDPARTMCKIDVQGYEGQVLDGASDVLPRLAGVRAELSLVPLYGDQLLMAEVVRRLESVGLALWLLDRGFTDPQSHRLLQADGTFFRP